MIIYQEEVTFELEAEFDVVDLSSAVAGAVQRSGIKNGLIALFNRGSTGALTTIEAESGCLADLRRALEKLAPADAEYDHNERWGDGNGFSHLRAALIGPSLHAPIINGRARFSTWQQPILLNFDNRDRERTVDLTLMGLG